MTPRTAVLGTLLLATATALSACGGASTTSSSTATTQAGAAAAQGTSATATGPTTGTKKDAGLPAAPTATVAATEFCESLEAAKFTPADVTEFTVATRKQAVDEVVSRMERLSQITPSADVAKEWRDVQDGFDTIADGASKASSDAALTPLIAKSLAEVAPAREKFLAAAKKCG